MSEPLLTIKTSIPRSRENLVARPRLVEKINLGMKGRLILVSAPAGFGKTTLVTSWITSTDRHIVWLSLEESENNIHTFLNYLLAALQTINDGIGSGLRHVLESLSHPQSEVLLSSLIAEIDQLNLPISLVFDDFHLIENKQIHAALEFLIHTLPAQVNVIVISRIDPPIPLARLRAGGDLTEIRSGDLRFTADEVDTFLNELMNLGLSPDDMKALRLRTEGWIAGLQLAALSLRDREDKRAFIERFSGSHQYIIDYLLEEVLDRLPETIRDFRNGQQR
jgi:LuxR family maltose regulon positive regulatory protein